MKSSSSEEIRRRGNKGWIAIDDREEIADLIPGASMPFRMRGCCSRKRLFTVALFGTAVVLIAALSWSLRETRLNVILITLDTTRADRLGAYGYQNGSTAGFDRYAQNGVLFERAYAPVPMTLPSHATMLTGLYPLEHGLRINGGVRLADDIPLLPKILKQRGYDTGGFIAAVVLNSKHGLSRGFDKYDDDLSKSAGNSNSLEPRRHGNDVVDSALSWLGARTSRPFFCWIHLFDAHAPYGMHEDKFGERFKDDPYDAGIAVEIEQVERVVNFLKNRRLDQKTLVVIVGDHGEGLNEHDEKEHGMQVYNATLRVPLLIVGPRNCKPGLRVPNPVSLADITPTLLDLLGIPAPKHFSGRSLRTALCGDRLEPRLCYAEAEAPFVYCRWCPLKTVISDRWKLIQTTKPELYDLESDPNEENNLVGSAIEEYQQMQNALELMLEEFVPAKAQNMNLSQKDEANLAALGYVAGGNSDRPADSGKAEVLPDIKDKMKLVVMFEKARDLVLNGQLNDGIRVLQEIARAGHEFTTAMVQLGECLTQANRLDEAQVVYQDVLTTRPDLVTARFNLAKITARLGQFNQAIPEFRKVIESDPEFAPAHFELAEALVAMKQFDQAIVEYRNAIQIVPSFVKANIKLGYLLSARKRTLQAINCYEQAIKYEPKSAIARSQLQALLVQVGQFRPAIEQGQELVELEPLSFDARFNLGVLLISQNRYDDGIAQLREAQKLRPDDPRPVQQLQQAEAALKRVGK
jgi:arylsulfatase A-like enzyme/Flp pilus assembly protein TadD